MPRPRKNEERKLRGIRSKSYTAKDGSQRVYWQYCVSVLGPDARRRMEWRNASRKRAAEEARTTRKAGLQRGEAVERAKLTVACWLAEWLPDYVALHELRPTTVEAWEGAIRRYRIPQLGSIPLQ